MNEQQLQLPDGTKTDAFRCGICGIIYTESGPQNSRLCCSCGECGKILDPKIVGHRAWLCDPCQRTVSATRDRDRLDKATEIAGYDGPVVIGDKFYGSVDDLIAQRDDGELPEFVHTCHVESYSLDEETILQDLLENADVEDHDESNLDGVKEFAEAVAAFNKANEKNVYWHEDSNHKVRVCIPKE